MAQEFNIGRMKAEAMAKAFGVDIEKGRVGVYEDNAENRRLNRVGQSYGHKAEEKPSTGRQPAKKEEQGQGKPTGQQAGGQDIGAAAKSASDEALKRAAADPNAAPEVKSAAEKELKERGGEEENKGKKIITISDYEDEELEEMSDPAFLKTFSKQVNDFLKKLDDDAISKIGYLKRADGSSTKTPVNSYLIDGSDDTIQVECWKTGGKYCCSIIFGKDLDYSHGARKIVWDKGKKFSTPEEAVEDLHKKISAVKEGEKLEFENW